MSQQARQALVVLVGFVGVAALARQPLGTPQLAMRAPPPVLSGEGRRMLDGEPLDLNRATAAELELLPGVGPKLASEIVRVREARRGFISVEALDEVRGIGAKKLAGLKRWLRVSERLEQPADAQ